MNRIANPFVENQCAAEKVSLPNIPVYLVEQYGQCAEDVIVASLLKALAKRQQFDLASRRYLEIGGNHPISTSASFLLASTLGMRGVIVEANPDLIEDLRLVRRDADVVHAAVHVGDGETTILSVSNANELSSLDRRFVLEWDEGHLGEKKQVEVPAIRINELLQRHFFDASPVYLSIDIEGLDLVVLEDMNFKNHRPMVIQAEPSDHHVPGNSSAMIKFLRSVDYELIALTDVNQIFVDLRLFASSEFEAARKEMEQTVSDRNFSLQKLNELQQRHIAVQDEVAYLREALNVESRLIAHLQEESARHLERAGALMQSHSWKITAPLRKVTDFFR
jgi:FkbM family methyltransferase